MINPHPIKVLLIEDEEIAQRVIKFQLETLSCRVDLAGTGKEAIALLKNKYHLILLDLGLPDMDGFTIAKKIKQESGINQQTPIVVQTANITEIYKRKCQENGIDAIYSKPFTSEQLKKIVDSYVK